MPLNRSYQKNNRQAVDTRYLDKTLEYFKRELWEIDGFTYNDRWGS